MRCLLGLKWTSLMSGKVRICTILIASSLLATSTAQAQDRATNLLRTLMATFPSAYDGTPTREALGYADLRATDKKTSSPPWLAYSGTSFALKTIPPVLAGEINSAQAVLEAQPFDLALAMQSPKDLKAPSGYAEVVLDQDRLWRPTVSPGPSNKASAPGKETPILAPTDFGLISAHDDDDAKKKLSALRDNSSILKRKEVGTLLEAVDQKANGSRLTLAYFFPGPNPANAPWRPVKGGSSSTLLASYPALLLVELRPPSGNPETLLVLPWPDCQSATNAQKVILDRWQAISAERDFYRNHAAQWSTQKTADSCALVGRFPGPASDDPAKAIYALLFRQIVGFSLLPLQVE